MKPTMKSINAQLPRFDYLRRTFRTSNQFGIVPDRTFSTAYADLDDNGNVRSISIYAVGDGRNPEHYYSEQHDDVVDITAHITDAIESNGLDACGYDAKRFRDMIIRDIQQTIMNSTNA